VLPMSCRAYIYIYIYIYIYTLLRRAILYRASENKLSMHTQPAGLAHIGVHAWRVHMYIGMYIGTSYTPNRRFDIPIVVFFLCEILSQHVMNL
jgi:hypothetical protein